MSVPVRNEQQPRPAIDAETCYQDQNHENADLCAQWRAARAAEEAADYAYWGNFVAAGGAALSFLSLVLIYMALRQGREANRTARDEFLKARREAAESAVTTASALAHASRSAGAAERLSQQAVESTKAAVRGVQAARRANEIAREAMRHQTRARMAVDRFYWNGNAEEGAQFGVWWKNAGASSTVRLRFYSNYVLRDDPLPDDYDFPVDEKLIRKSHVSPGSHPIRSSPAPRDSAIGPEDWRAIAMRRRYLYVYGWARYYDVFDPKTEHVTKFCCRPLQATDAEGEPIFIFEFFDRHNCADEGCEDD